MNIFYAKAVLYAYPNIDAVIGQIDELVERKALSSISDFSPCIEQCEKILNFSKQKCALIILKDSVQKILSTFTEQELICLDYKYFHKKKKSEYAGFDFFGRNYFRKQIRIANKFSDKLEKAGITDEWFDKNCMCTDFFVELVRRVKEYEIKAHKNKGANANKVKKNTSELSA